MSLTKDFSVTGNAGDYVFLHVSASSERQEWWSKAGGMTKKTEQHTLTHIDGLDSTFL
jgi:uncharacterized protein (UPF0548 family)